MGRETAITIEANGSTRKVLEIQERASKDITIILRFGKHLTVNATTSKTVNETIRKAENDVILTEVRFSIHNSYASKKNVNAIKFTYVQSDGTKTCQRHYTKAIKSGRVAMVFAERCSNLLNERYDFKPKGRSDSLGKFNPAIFQLNYIVVAHSAKEELFRYDILEDMNIKKFKFGTITIIILWCFSGFWSDSTQNLYLPYTISDEQKAELGNLALKASHEKNAIWME